MKSNKNNKNHSTVSKYRKDTLSQYRRAHAKPRPAKVILPDGTVRYFGIKDAAKWIGCTGPALGMVLRGVPGRGNVIRSKAMQEFPELFK